MSSPNERGNHVKTTNDRQPRSATGLNRYGTVMLRIFREKRPAEGDSFVFEREDLVRAASLEGVALPKNLGDVVYSFRYRAKLPDEIRATQPEGFEWIIEGAGKARYRFRLSRINHIEPRSDLAEIKLPDSTPEIISAHALSDEQALLAKTRYNRLIDTFLGVTAHSLQNHLRTTVPGIGQIEVDEVYLAVDKFGRQFVVPVQAKGGHDKHAVIQTLQDIAWCHKALPALVCRPVSVQFVKSDKIAMFELTEENGSVKVVEERHYRLVPANKITRRDLEQYALHAR